MFAPTPQLGNSLLGTWTNELSGALICQSSGAWEAAIKSAGIGGGKTGAIEV